MSGEGGEDEVIQEAETAQDSSSENQPEEDGPEREQSDTSGQEGEEQPGQEDEQSGAIRSFLGGMVKRLFLVLAKAAIELSIFIGIALSAGYLLSNQNILPQFLDNFFKNTTSIQGAVFAILILFGRCFSIPRDWITERGEGS